jgi:hypothetical protein
MGAKIAAESKLPEEVMVEKNVHLRKAGLSSRRRPRHGHVREGGRACTRRRELNAGDLNTRLYYGSEKKDYVV